MVRGASLAAVVLAISLGAGGAHADTPAADPNASYGDFRKLAGPYRLIDTLVATYAAQHFAGVDADDGFAANRQKLLDIYARHLNTQGDAVSDAVMKRAYGRTQDPVAVAQMTQMAARPGYARYRAVAIDALSHGRDEVYEAQTVLDHDGTLKPDIDNWALYGLDQDMWGAIAADAAQLKTIADAAEAEFAALPGDHTLMAPPVPADYVTGTVVVREAEMAAFYPKRAVAEEVMGSADIDCRVLPNSHFTDCKVVTETPPHVGFGGAAAALYQGSVFMMNKGVKIGPNTRMKAKVRWGFNGMG